MLTSIGAAIDSDLSGTSVFVLYEILPDILNASTKPVPQLE
jgi:hypothetical protein